MQEIAHLHKAAELLQKYENKNWAEIIPSGDFPKLLKLEPNVDYVRDILANTAANTSNKEGYIDVSLLSEENEFFFFFNKVNKTIADVPSHAVIERYLNKNKEDYRFETKPNPLKELQNRGKDNTTLGRN